MLEDLNNALADLGGKAGVDDLGIEDENGRLLVFDDDLAVQIDYDEESGDAILSSQIGQLEDDPGSELLLELLDANLLWKDTGNATLGLEANTGLLFLSTRRPSDWLTGERLEKELGRFVDHVEFWRKVIEKRLSETGDDAPEPAAGTGGIKV